MDKGLLIEVDYTEVRKYKTKVNSSKHVKITGVDAGITQYGEAFVKYVTTIGKEDIFNPVKPSHSDPIGDTQKCKKQVALLAELEADFIKKHPSPYTWMLENERLSDTYGQIVSFYIQNDPIPSDLLMKIMEHQPKFVSNSGMMYYYGYLNDHFYFYSKGFLKQRIKKFVKRVNQIVPTSEKRDFIKMIGGSRNIAEYDTYMSIVLPSIENQWIKELMQKE